MPVFTPGSITIGSFGRYRLTIWRRLARIRGTPEQIAVPVISVSKSTSIVSSIDRTITEYSSLVRSCTVEMRQWSTRPTAAPSPVSVSGS